MTKDIENKVAVCFREVEACLQVIEGRRADDFAARLLSIYITMRVDDITKMWCHSLSKDTLERALADTAKDVYNDGFRRVRDKIGAHYQSADDEGRNDIFASAQLFRSFDYKDISVLVDEMEAARSLIEGGQDVAEAPLNIQDLSAINEVLERYYADDRAALTNSAVEMFGPNRGGLITCTPAQRKGQFLRGIELMIEYARALADIRFVDELPDRLFKRLLICLVYSYVDNLRTRTDISSRSVQNEQGFDEMYMSLISPRDDRSKVENAFDRHEDLHHCYEYFRRHRFIRDKACAHFDEGSTMTEIDAVLDKADMSEILSGYDKLLSLFNYICRNTFCLQPLTLPARSVMPNARFESVTGKTDFYNRGDEEKVPAQMSPDEIMRSIRKQYENRDLAKEQMIERLMAYNDEIYYPMMGAIIGRLMEIRSFEEDFPDIIEALERARRGYPDRLQRDIMWIILQPVFSNLVKFYLIRSLALIAHRDDKFDIRQELNHWLGSQCYPLQAIVAVAYLHYLLNDSAIWRHPRNKAMEVDYGYRGKIEDIKNPVKALGVWLLVCHRWNWDEEYGYIRQGETIYDAWLNEGLEMALRRYAEYVGLRDDGEWQLWESYRRTGHFLLLLYRLAVMECERGAKDNRFMELWRWNCFIRIRRDMYEAFGVGLMDELCGNVESARSVFEDIVRENPLSEDAQRTLADFHSRHSSTR